jgi:hypothetical protein
MRTQRNAASRARARNSHAAGSTLRGRNKLAVRDLTEEAIAAGRPAAELKELRASMADVLGVSRSNGS